MINHSQSLSQLVMEYLAKKRGIRQSTRDFTLRAFRYLVEAVGKIEVADCDNNMAEDYQVFLADKLSLRSANSYIKTISPVFSWAARRKEWPLDKNPFEGLRPFRTSPLEIRVFQPAEVRAMLVASKTNMWSARILAALTGGLRRSEVLNLTWHDIDFERQMMTVRAKQGTTLTWQWQPKDYEVRQVPLVPRLANILLLIETEIPAGQPYPFLTEQRYWTLHQRLRLGTLSERVTITPDENWRPFRKILRLAEIKDGCFHDLRRTAITEWAKSLPIRDVMSLAGHSSIETTQKYYLALGADYLERSLIVSQTIGATGLEPATS